MFGNRRRSLAFLLPALAVVALAGCDSDSIGPEPGQGPDGGVGSRRAATTLEWNRIALTKIETHKPGQHGALRGMAYLTLAQYGAADASREHFPRPTATQGAIAGASAVVLTYLYPSDSAAFEAAVRGQEAALEPGRQAGFRVGEALGRTIGAKAVALARNDRFHTPWNGTVPTGPGIWYSSTVPATPPVLPLLGQMQPFFMSAGNHFRPAAPPAFDSPAFAEAVAEVRLIADTRTARQDSIAKFWAMGTGTLIAGYWNSTAAELIERGRLDERQAAHALALMNTAAMDGLIACSDAKYAYWLLRPTQADPGISLAIGLPNFPSYPSNHACFSGAAAYVLGALFPREEQRLTGLAYDAAISRVFGGIHYRFDGDAGLSMAREISRLALDADRSGGMLQLLR